MDFTISWQFSLGYILGLLTGGVLVYRAMHLPKPGSK